MKKLSLFLTVFLLLSYSGYAQWKVNTVPDPKTTGLGFISNPDNILLDKEVAYLDSIIQEVQDSSKAQIAIVMLQSIGDEVPKTFATELFNLWGVGNAETDNGLLILFVMDQRRIEFETGYGTEQILSDAKSYEIQQEFMVPRFKEGNYGKGIVEGTEEIVRIFMGRAEEIKPTDNESSLPSDDYNYNNNYDYSFYSRYREELNLYFIITALALGLFFLLFIISVVNKDYFARYQTMRIFRLYFWFILFPVPFIGIYIFVKRISEKWRNTPRISAKTGLIMHKLSETEDDKYLEKGQVAEEKVKSVDYDVWISGDDDDVLIQAYKRWFSKYNSCPKCKYKTYYKVYDKVIRAATYSSSGKGERHYKCTNCGHSKTTTYTIPKKTKTSSSSSGSSSWGGSSSSSWSSGGSSSWGGGSSGGGGAGSSW